jgi:hypothetical protein
MGGSDRQRLAGIGRLDGGKGGYGLKVWDAQTGLGVVSEEVFKLPES